MIQTMSRVLDKFITPRQGPAPVVWVFALAAVASMAAPLLAHRLDLVRNNYDVGHADSAAYALQGRSLAEGHGLRIPYVTGFFHRYSPDIWREDDHWPPFLAFILAPVFRIAGPDAAMAHATTVTLGAVALPLAAAGLAAATTGRLWAALLGGVLLFLPVRVMTDSIAILCDIPLAMLVACYAAALLASRRHRPILLAAGFFGAMAFYAKGSQVVLLPLLPGLAVILHGWRILANRWLLGAVLVFLMLVSPRWISFAREFGNPLHSTQNYVAAHFGLDGHAWRGWDESFYRVCWNQPPPHFADRFRHGDALRRGMRGNLGVYLSVVLLGPDANGRGWPRLGKAGGAIAGFLDPETRRPGPPRRRHDRPPPPAPDVPWLTHPREWPAWYATILGAAGLTWGALCLLACAVALPLQPFLRRLIPAPDDAAHAPYADRLVRAAAVLATLLVVEAGFVIVMWHAFPRFTTVVLPLAYALGMSAIAGLVHAVSFPVRRVAARHAPPPWLRHARWLAAGMLCACASFAWARQVDAIAAEQQATAKLSPPAKPTYPRYHGVARWVTENIPHDAVLMTRNPWELLFYCPSTVRAVGMPHATPDVIFAIARYYGVTHFIWDCNRPGLETFLRNGHPALTRLTDSPLPVYAVDYTRFSPGELADMDAPPASDKLVADRQTRRAPQP